jgi:hypothetical protein
MDHVLQRKRKANRVWGGLLWAVFAAGILVQLLAPNLKVQNGKFVLPPDLFTGKAVVQPDQIVARERKVQALSGLLTVCGAVGLAFYYRHIFAGPRTSEVKSKGEMNQ